MFEDINPQDFESRTAADKSVYIKFYIRPVQDEAESDKAGRAIFRDVEYIEIRTPGQQTNVIQRPVNSMDRERFRTQYRMFKEGQTEQTVGTPLEECAWITRSQVEELSYMRVRTLEALADLNDQVCGSHPGLYKLKQKAAAVLASAAGAAPITAMQSQIDDMKEQLAAAQATIKQQADLLRKFNKE